MCPKKLSQPAHPHSLIKHFVVRMKKLSNLANQNVLSEDSDQTTDAQADLNLRWAHMS